MEFTLEDISDAEIARRRALFEPLTDAVRGLIDATIRTEVDDDTIRDVQQMIADATDRLRAAQIDGAYGVRYTADMQGMPWGNAVIGVRNAIAPPLRTVRHPDGLVSTDFVLGAAYEGPPGCVHGGVAALLLDQVLGEAASADQAPGYTGTISVRYLRPTPLGALHSEAIIVERQGRKKIVRGSISDADGQTVTAEGVFIVPKTWEGPMPHSTRGAPS
ncbi:PaaI family thioesterase [Gordonia sp. CPCC 205515]|uniref:PaaI family thioesterase n=1 Tax=Gordonia sp. CPCC 205515 TaxID=3140791 RepID=UPI003AF39338